MPKHHHHHYHYHRERSGYARDAGRPGPGPNPHRFYRSRSDRWFAGVCGGIAEYFDWNPGFVRLAVFVSFFFFGPLTFFAYVGAALLTKSRPDAPSFRDVEEERFWRTMTTRPRMGMGELKHKFRAIDARIADMERAVVTEEYGLRRAFKDLERGAN